MHVCGFRHVRVFAHVHVSPESLNSIIVNISFDGASGSGCWTTALLSFGTELPTSGLRQHSLTVCVCAYIYIYMYVGVCVCVCVYFCASEPDLMATGWGTDLLRSIKGVPLIKRSPLPPSSHFKRPAEHHCRMPYAVMHAHISHGYTMKHKGTCN